LQINADFFFRMGEGNNDHYQLTART